MSRKEKPLPTPASPGSRFKEDERSSTPLMADQMAMAAAAGKIEQFMEEALPDNEHARKLATMMMGMTGMMPPTRTEASPAAGQDQPPPNQHQNQPMSGIADTGTPETPVALPDEVVQAVKNADVKGLMNLLKQEHSKRSGDSATVAETDTCAQQAPSQQKAPLHEPSSHQAPSHQAPPASIEKMLIDRVVAIAFEHDLTPDWVVMRALKLYVEGYEKTGRL